ncbi:DUF4132 domain-containing protein [Pseudomonas sp. H9]|uniref:DUF4132 domain-containing protein n=1 Tax=Pseudomonas sp. H9 TaxID=483968 RepID=UPI0010582316|nr:DUF4132 domain-containing protein [Pseudomonas sp. H9]TDF81581.1 DUF4132 domain-containing protein [Pseudomonas sp. H9]
MALEQLHALINDTPQTVLGAFEQIGPDGFPLLASCELRHEHQAISALLPVLQTLHGQPQAITQALAQLPVIQTLAQPQQRVRLILALIERIVAYDSGLSRASLNYELAHSFDDGVMPTLVSLLMQTDEVLEQVAVPVLQWITSYRFGYYHVLPTLTVVNWVVARQHLPMPAPLLQLLRLLRSQCADSDLYCNSTKHGSFGQHLTAKLDPLLGNGAWQLLMPCEVWTQVAIAELNGLPAEHSEHWLAVLSHAATATTARPSAKWLKSARLLIDTVGNSSLRAALLRWFAHVDAGRTGSLLFDRWQSIDDRARMSETNAIVLRGLLWMTPLLADSELTRALTRVTLSAYRKVHGIGARAPKVGNAAVYALSSIATPEALGQLALLKARVKLTSAQKELEKAFSNAAQALALPRDQIEELCVPSYGLEQVGLRREAFAEGAYLAELRVEGKDVTLNWFHADGTPQKSTPAKVKADANETLKELQTAVKDISVMLTAQALRLDTLFLLEKTWPLEHWQQHYLDHPLVGTLTRRLIWAIREGEQSLAVMFSDGGLRTVEGHSVSFSNAAEVSLWHPVGRPLEDILAWRERIESLQITQPFKQAHREVYLLTDAERQTATYSNRFAAHIVRQHQFHTLAISRGWRNTLRLMVDASYPPATRELPAYGLRAEFWIDGVGDNYGVDTNDSGTFLHLSTDQLRFYRSDAEDGAALSLDQVPARALSEVMRDIDLFVGVASLATDPHWIDGGPEGRLRDYWQAHSFGELSATAQTRKQLLEKLLPRMTRLKNKWALHGRFLEVTGTLRSYKIHLGSSNILMQPNDQYLCIVPDAKARTKATPDYLPFEGDALLSIILSKALLLIDDDKISDPTITRQLALQ